MLCGSFTYLKQLFDAYAAALTLLPLASCAAEECRIEALHFAKLKFNF